MPSASPISTVSSASPGRSSSPAAAIVAAISGGAKASQCAAILAAATVVAEKPRSASWSSVPESRSGATSRSTGSSAASNAAAQITPPPIRASSFWSGPTAKGNRIATSRKKATISVAPPEA